MVRAWILLSSLTLSVIFKLWPDYGDKIRTFPFSAETLNTQSWVYYLMEHVIAIAVALCLVIKDATPKFMLVLFACIMGADLLHYLLFYRDTGIGFNLVKVVVYLLPLLALELTKLWKRFNRLRNQG